MKNCERYELLASQVLDGEASREEQAELAAHLEACPACRAYWEDIKRIHGTFAQEEAVLPEGFAARVMDQVRRTGQDQPEQEKKTVPFPRWRRWAALAACCAVVMLGAWAVWGAGSRTDSAAADQDIAVDARMRSADDAAAQEPVPFAENVEAAGDGGTPDEAPAPTPKEAAVPSVSAAMDGADEGTYQPAEAAAPPSRDSMELDTVSDGFEQQRTDEKTSEIQQEPEEDAMEQSVTGPVLPLPEEDAEDAAEDSSEDLPEDDLEEEESEDVWDQTLDGALSALEPVEVIGVPEPGILIAYGSAAQKWVENILGLEWAAGGSYPLTSEQYGDLLRTLDEAGELYQIEPGEGYCLMTE